MIGRFRAPDNVILSGYVLGAWIGGTVHAALPQP
jgi:hypothetical protein